MESLEMTKGLVVMNSNFNNQFNISNTVLTDLVKEKGKTGKNSSFGSSKTKI